MLHSPFRMKLESSRLLTDPRCDDSVRLVRLVPLTGEAQRPFTHGQCVRLGIPGLRKPAPAYFAIASSPEDEGGYEFVVKQSGDMAQYLCQLESGSEIEVDGPMGKGFDLDAMRNRNVLLVGVGTGIAPLRSLWRSIVRQRNDFGKVSVHAGFLTSLHRLLVDETNALTSHGIEVHTTLPQAEEGWSGPIGYVQHSLEELAPSSANTVACLAGMTPMIEGCRDVLHRLGFDDSQILLNF